MSTSDFISDEEFLKLREQSQERRLAHDAPYEDVLAFVQDVKIHPEKRRRVLEKCLGWRDFRVSNAVADWNYTVRVSPEWADSPLTASQAMVLQSILADISRNFSEEVRRYSESHPVIAELIRDGQRVPAFLRTLERRGKKLIWPDTEPQPVLVALMRLLFSNKTHIHKFTAEHFCSSRGKFTNTHLNSVQTQVTDLHKQRASDLAGHQ